MGIANFRIQAFFFFLKWMEYYSHQNAFANGLFSPLPLISRHPRLRIRCRFPRQVAKVDSDIAATVLV